MSKCHLLRLRSSRTSKRRLISVAVTLTILAIFPFLAWKVIHLIHQKVYDFLHTPRMVDLQTFKDTASQLRMSETEEHNTYSLLARFHRLMTKFDIEYVGYGGTVLGAGRHAALIPWDDDADFVIMKRNKPLLLRAIATQDTLKLCYMNDDFYKVTFRNQSLSKESNKYCAWPNLDIFLAHEMGSQLKVVFQGIYIYDKTSFFPSVVVPFGPLYLRFPRCFLQMAIQEYDITKCCTGSWNHRTEDWAPRPACIQCKELQDHVSFANFTKVTDLTTRLVLRRNVKTIREELVSMPTCERVSVQFIKPSSYSPVVNF